MNYFPSIERFRGKYFFLSNVSPAPTPHRNHLYPTSEHAYMAARTSDADAIAAIRNTPDPIEAQRLGRAAQPVPDWLQRRFAVMRQVVTAKFDRNLDLAVLLSETGIAPLVEGNDWHDQTWGCCRCVQHDATPGANSLGLILMDVRTRIVSRRR